MEIMGEDRKPAMNPLLVFSSIDEFERAEEEKYDEEQNLKKNYQDREAKEVYDYIIYITWLIIKLIHVCVIVKCLK